MIPLLLALGCIPDSQAQEAVLLAGQASLSVDHWRGTATLRVQTYLPAPSPLPEERQGLAMDACKQLDAGGSGLDPVFRAAEVKAVCEGVELALTDHGPGGFNFEASALPSPGTQCHVVVDGQAMTLPPLPAMGEPSRDGRTLTWSPAGADEVRVVTLDSAGGMGRICRTQDDGELKLPRKMRQGITFVTWHNAEHRREDGTVFALSSTTGTWLEDPK